VALDQLLRTLEEEANARIAALLARARTDAEQFRAGRASESARRRATALAAREAELRVAAARAIEAGRREARRLVLQARAEVLERIRRRAEALLAERAADPALLALQAGDLERALDYVGNAPAVVEAPARLLPGLQAMLNGRARVVAQSPTAPRPGLVVRADDGALTVDATPGGRLARAWPRLTIDLAGRLETLA
jgi:vacuolar-type H+-ATPase subunit E/Vma4